MSQARGIPGGPASPVAPTPQNTPAAHMSASQYSRPQVPTTIGEDEGEEPVETISSGNAGQAAAIANHPLLASMVQSRLSGLVGRSSGYLESLPNALRHRVDGLQGLQVEHAKIEADFQKEVLELEKKFLSRYQPLYERRLAIISGKAEPTSEEVQKGIEAEQDEDDDDEDDDDEEAVGDDDEAGPKAPRQPPTAEEVAAAPKGIPGFWLTALSNHLGISELITERDEACLKHLDDIRVSYLADRPGFELTFSFGPGAREFFENAELVKTYYYQDEVGYGGDFVYERAQGTEIKWKEGKDLTTKLETKKQRNKNTNQTRVVKKVVQTESFFNFFKPPVPPSDDDDDDVASEDQEDLEEKLELDYQIGEDLKERIVPRAVDFFTGKALRFEHQPDGDFSDEFDEEDFDEDDDDDEDEDAGRLGVPGARRTRRAPVPPASGVTPASNQDPQECKQQ